MENSGTVPLVNGQHAPLVKQMQAFVGTVQRLAIEAPPVLTAKSVSVFVVGA